MSEGGRLWASAIREAGYWRFEETAIIELGKGMIERIDNALTAERERIRKLALEPSEEMIFRVGARFSIGDIRFILRAFAKEIER